ncbi:MAG TPA: 30S ribosome-binding factor RbfA [Candidatus Bathyarchaeia archaeon]|nr:30S ribosome-binding factor RbfA [Candidatus Bathyarchaeia archaeon]
MGRMDRINQLVKREIGLILQEEFHDPRLQFVSILWVKVSPDLQVAHVGFSFLGEKKQVSTVESALSCASGRVRHLMSQRIELRHTPQIEFVYDPSLDYSAKVEDVLEGIKREIPFDDQKPAERQGEEP